MNSVFEIVDKFGRKIRLTKTQWKHIRKKHPEVENPLQIEESIKNPDKIIEYDPEEKMVHYYKYFKDSKSPGHLLVVVKYLNGEGFILTAYFMRNIKWKN